MPMKEIVKAAKNMAEDPSRFSEVAFTKERHVKSGAEAIIPGVLSFLEDEPIEKILDEFENAGYLAAPESLTF
jgi:hypothetical protein